MRLSISDDSLWCRSVGFSRRSVRGEYQSMRSALCASAPSHPLHAMPPRITRNSDRPRASYRTMVDIVLLAASCTLELYHQQQRNLTRMNNRPNLFRGNETSGLDLEKQSRSSGQGGAFFLDIPFYRTH